ncbi:MAG: recombinase family protein [Alphaproteobacteria bacterium]
MKAVILARVSTKEQEDGHSLEAQIVNLRLYADRKGLEIIKEYIVIESSTKGERPEFMRMIDFIKAQKQKVAVVVDTVDRLQRSFKETPILNDLLQKGVLELHFVKEGNVLSQDANSMQKAMWNIGVVMAQSYTDSLSDNVKRSIKHKVANGEWSGPAPLGYLNSINPMTGKKTIIQDPERAYLIKKFFEEFATGAYSLAELGRKAKGWGLRSRKSNTVSVQTLHDLIQNSFYYGMMTVKNELHPHKYDPLISKELFDACQVIRTGRGRTQAVVETKYPFILRGLLKCAVSGKKVACDIKKGKHIYLISHDPADPTRKIWTKEDIVLDQIRDVFRSIQIPEAVLTEIIDSLKKTHQSEKDYHQASVKSLTHENELVTKRLDALLDEYLDKSITKDMYDRKHGQLIQRRQEIQEMLERHHAGDKQFRIAVSTLVSLASKAGQIFDRSTTDEKRQLIGYLFANLELKGSRLCYSLKNPFNLFMDLASYQEWLPGPDSNQRPSD